MNPTVPHKWSAPPAGQGSSRDRVCTVCGYRRSVVGESSGCNGTGRDVTIETKHEYDPYA